MTTLTMTPPRDDRFIAYPTNTLFSIIDDPARTEQALRALAAAGFAGDTRVYQGEEGVCLLDASGARHGWLAQLWRLHQRTTQERDHVELYEQALLNGESVLAIHVSDQESLDRVQQILSTHGGHFINYYGRFGIRGLAR